MTGYDIIVLILVIISTILININHRRMCKKPETDNHDCWFGTILWIFIVSIFTTWYVIEIHSNLLKHIHIFLSNPLT